jgi:hypothetical protein
MSLLDFCAAAAGGWLILAALGGTSGASSSRPTSAALAASSGHTRPQVPAPVTPPITQADIDSTWLTPWPTAVDEDDLMNREFVSLISAAWDWTEPQP